MCKNCNNGRLGSEGYWIYCSCKEGRDRYWDDKVINDIQNKK